MRLFISLITALLVSGCVTTPTATIQQGSWTPERHYSEARKAQSSGDYKAAIKHFGELEVIYPHSPYSQLVPIETGYAYYKLKQFDTAVNEVERFINTYPEHNNIDYAYYLKGLARSEQARGQTTSDSQTTATINTDLARQAFNSFSTVIQKFPDSQYRDNALQRMNTLRKQLARHELQRVKTRLKSGAKEDAIKLAKYISEQYPNTPAAAEAFEIISRASSTLVSSNNSNSPATNKTEVQAARQSHPAKEAQREKWLLQQNPTHFTLQLIGTSSQDKLKAYIRQHKLEDQAAYFRRSLNNKDWYSLLYGNYTQRNAAATTAKQLKNRLKLENIWIRQFKDIQASINQNKHNN